MKTIRKKIVSLHDFEKADLLEEIAERQISTQDKEYLYVIAGRFHEILREVVKATFGLELDEDK